MDRIQITTTKETAETVGYALMGARNRLHAAIHQNTNPLLADGLRKDLSPLDMAITAFAQADIVESEK